MENTIQDAKISSVAPSGAARGAAAPRVWPRVSVIVITRDRHTQAEAAVASILADDYPPDRREIIVLEETATPQPIVGPGVRYTAIPVRDLGFGVARNQGLRLAGGDIIAFTDDDCRVERGWLRELVRPLLEQPDAVAVLGAVLVPPCGPIGECEHILGFPGGGLPFLHAAGGRVVRQAGLSTCNCAVAGDALRRVGGFHESLRHGGEDSLLGHALHALGTILYNPAARVRHQPRDSLAGVWRWFLRRGQACIEQERVPGNPQAQGWRLALRSPLLRLAAVTGLCAALRLPLGWSLGLLAVVYYAVLLWRYRWARAYYPAWRTRAWLPAVKILMDIGTDFGLLRRLLAAEKRE